ncbi:hypothetical protein DRQ18_03170, partial [bacterium]
EDVERMQEELGVLFQEGEPLDFLKVRDNLLLAGIEKNEIESLLKKVGLEGKDLDKYPAELSGGMKRRVALLMALGKKKALYVLDEPLSGLDEETRRDIMEITGELLKSRTALVITHDKDYREFLREKLKARVEDVEHILIPFTGDRRNIRFNSVKAMKGFLEEIGKIPLVFLPLRSPLPYLMDFFLLTLPFILAFGVLVSFSYVYLLSRVRLFYLESRLPSIFSLVCVRGLAPLLTAIIASSRITSNFTSTIAGMSLKKQLFLLRTMGKPPERFLLSPAFLSLLFAVPFLTWSMFFTMGKAGGFFAGRFLSWCTTLYFSHQYFTTPGASDIIKMLVKGSVYGGIMAFVSYYTGKKAKRSVSEIGKLTSFSLLLALFFIFLFDFILNVVLY